MKRKLLPNLSSFETDKKNFSLVGTDYVYVVGTDEGWVKIGTTNDWWGRIKKLQGMSPKKLEPLIFWSCQSGKSIEAAVHALFRDYRKHGEWFYFGHHLSGYGDWKYRHLALSALLTCCRPPIPINGSILHTIQFEHIPHDDPIYEVPGGGDWTGRECYPHELFAPFYPNEDGTLRLLGWPDEIRQLYGFQ